MHSIIFVINKNAEKHWSRVINTLSLFLVKTALLCREVASAKKNVDIFVDFTLSVATVTEEFMSIAWNMT